MSNLVEYLEERKDDKHVQLFFDIETFQYNEDNGKDFPSEYKNMTYSVAVSWIVEGEVGLEVFPNFKEFFDSVLSVYQGKRKQPTITLNAHNTNKYDNHFMRYDILYYYPHTTIENYFITTGTTTLSNENSLRMKDIKKKEKEGIILEKRIKSSINLEMTFFLYGVKFQTLDNWQKTNSSISMLGVKLLKLGVVTEDELKTDFNYTKYNKSEDLTEEQARKHAQYIFENITPSEMKYIHNDVILLAKSVYYYSKLFNGFDYSKRTFTSNILESYNTNKLTSYQLLNKVKGEDKKSSLDIQYTQYHFSNMNFYDYLKSFYRGGLNFYNERFIGKIIKDGVFSIDINSSYPYAMHGFKIPTFLKEYEEYSQPTIKEIEINDDIYTLYQLTKETFDKDILSRIDSIVIRQMLVKYYTTNDFININSYTFRLIEKVTGIKFTHVKVLSWVSFDTYEFGSKEKLEEYYEIKTRGSKEKKIEFNSPYDIKELDELNDTLYTSEEVDSSKVNLNGLYGIPALRPYFNLFRYDKKTGLYVNIENGHKNAERNILFSVFVTSVSLWNLLSPLGYLTQEEIDENFLYCDTDSLYLKKAVQHKLPTDLFSKFILGKWDIEQNDIKKFYVLNHKKYAYEYFNKKKNKMDIKVKSGGIPLDSFNTNVPFEDFIMKQFSHGVELDTLKSIYNKQNTISIYMGKTKLEVGKGYRIRSNSPIFDIVKKKIFEEIKGKDLQTHDVLYIESVVGTFSLSDINPVVHDVSKTEPLIFLEVTQDNMKILLEE